MSLFLVPQPTFSSSRPRKSHNGIAGYYLPLDVSRKFGVRLRTLREQRELSQERMAILFGIDRTLIRDVESGRKAVSLLHLVIIAKGMKVGLGDLLADL